MIQAIADACDDPRGFAARLLAVGRCCSGSASRVVAARPQAATGGARSGAPGGGAACAHGRRPAASRGAPRARRAELEQRRTVARPRARPAVRDVGEAPCTPLPDGGALGWARRTSRRTRRSTISSAGTSPRSGPRRGMTSLSGRARGSETLRPRWSAFGCGTSATRKAGAPRPAACAAPRSRDARPGALPATWDAALLVHARRTGILPERYRPLVFNTKNPPSVPTFLVDGSVAGDLETREGGRAAHAVPQHRPCLAARASGGVRTARRVPCLISLTVCARATIMSGWLRFVSRI